MGGSVGDVELERAQVLANEGGDVTEAAGRRDLVGEQAPLGRDHLQEGCSLCGCDLMPVHFPSRVVG